METKELKYIITENWEEACIANLFGEEDIATLKYQYDENGNEVNHFNPETEYLEVTVKRVSK